VRPLIFFAIAAPSAFITAESGAPVRPHHAAGLRRDLLRLAGVCLVPPLVPILMPLFWFLAKTGFLLFVSLSGFAPRCRASATTS
jgi:hypothetical protein